MEDLPGIGEAIIITVLIGGIIGFVLGYHIGAIGRENK